MTDILGAFEIFKVAEKIEVNGAEFYSKQSQIAKDEEASKLFQSLEKAEIGHRKKFHEMHGDISPEQRKLKNFSGDQSSYLEALADENVFALREFGDYSDLSLNDAIDASIFVPGWVLISNRHWLLSGKWGRKTWSSSSATITGNKRSTKTPDDYLCYPGKIGLQET